ncbi:MAG: family 10 glycosylhydrolase [Leptolyngbyaceae cyanobacterium SL_1_1]|nr:family 10 glycosylhydrolase [Leptolyngbyaceae cyanobacterium RM1_1_2]NJO10099.1 family 10 glycosylhydrolase [Leptolyngbyaceae cyanobacterium SL_1_1]
MSGSLRKQFQVIGRIAAGVLGSLLNVLLTSPSANAQLNSYCQLSQSEVTRKENLRQALFEGEEQVRQQYEALVQQHANQMQTCRNRTWPRDQATWIRLYPCDLQPGVLEAVLDRIVNLGYNNVYVEVFYGGQVMLPAADNPTVWPSLVQTRGYERRDLLAETIEKGQQRGLQVSAWVFALNFGYSYSQRPDRQQVIARNGSGEDTRSYASRGASSNPDEVFVDPYSPLAQQDFRQLSQAIVQRRPDGMLYDYIRYPRGTGTDSVADDVRDLWIYSNSAQQALYRRALNNKGLELIRRYLRQGSLTNNDIEEVDRLYSDEGEPMWQSRVLPPATGSLLPASVRRPGLQQELWLLSVAHAVQGVVDFLEQIAQPVQRQGIPVGAVFFPGGNRAVGSRGYDSRLQHWNRFPTWMSWHPMAYGICGNTSCIVDEVREVLAQAGPGGENLVKPVIAGSWGQSFGDRPALETQMQALQQVAPRISSVSHFAFSWQDPEFDRVRKFCQLPEQQ